MNLKQFLQAKEIVPVTEEVLFPVVLGVGTFMPFHTGYLPILSKMVSESERFKCDAIVIVLESEQTEFAVSKIKEIAPGLRIMVRKDISEALTDLSVYQRAPFVIYSDKQSAPATKHICEQLYPFSALEVDTDTYLGSVERKINKAIAESNFLAFHSWFVGCPLIESRNYFKSVRVLNG
jgi:hypothetical protein